MYTCCDNTTSSSYHHQVTFTSKQGHGHRPFNPDLYLPFILQSIVGMLGGAANIFALIIMCRYTRLIQKPSFHLIVNQATIDMVAGLLIGMQYTSVLVGGHDLAHPTTMPVTSSILCRFW